MRPILRSAAIALLAVVTAAGCSVELGQSPPASWNSPAACGATPGTAGVWRPAVGYCEY